MEKFIPTNKHLLVEKVKQSYSELIPEEFQDKMSAYSYVKILNASNDCNPLFIKGLKVVVQTNGIEEIITSSSDKYHIVSEGFVVGYVMG